MSLVPNPRASILFLIWVCHHAFSLLTTFLKLSSVDFSILPDFGAEALHICIFELTGVGLFHVCEVVGALTFKDPIDKVSLVVTSISPLVDAMAILLAVFKHALIL